LKTIFPQDLPTAAFHGLMLGAVAPRPIAFASTIDAEGRPNLSPYSFFNAFSSNPPTLIFSPSRRVRDNTTKHTLENVYEHPEVVINIVSYEMVEQMSLSSTEYDKGVNEFVKAGFTEVASVKVKPPRVGEAPAAFECKVKRVIPLGGQGGAGNLIVAEVLAAHFSPNILDAQMKVDPRKLDAVARMGGNWYCRANGEALFEIPKPLATKGIGIDALPQHIRESHYLTGNNLGRLGNVEALPTEQEVKEFARQPQLLQLKEQHRTQPEQYKAALHKWAQQLLEGHKVRQALLVLMQQNA